MTWKSYAAFSGAGLLATYLFSSPPAPTPQRSPSARPDARPTASRIDIQAEAARLNARARGEVAYQEPSRNPFRFDAQPAVRAPAPAPDAAAAGEPFTAPPEPPPLPQEPPLRLSGIATTTVDGARQRTAVIVTLQGIVPVREGDRVAGEYRVTRIDEDAVELVADDGTPRLLRLRP